MILKNFIGHVQYIYILCWRESVRVNKIKFSSIKIKQNKKTKILFYTFCREEAIYMSIARESARASIESGWCIFAAYICEAAEGLEIQLCNNRIIFIVGVMLEFFAYIDCCRVRQAHRRFFFFYLSLFIVNNFWTLKVNFATFFFPHQKPFQFFVDKKSMWVSFFEKKKKQRKKHELKKRPCYSPARDYNAAKIKIKKCSNFFPFCCRLPCYFQSNLIIKNYYFYPNQSNNKKKKVKK